MKKIKTIFERDWKGNGKIINKPAPGVSLEVLALNKAVIATEKLDGTNIRVTVRNHFPVRVEKRRNPDKIQKQKGIIEPWYVDATEGDPQDKYIFAGIRKTDFSSIPEGEWSAELVGPGVQGNSLNLPTNRIAFFSLGNVPHFENVPTSFEELKEWLPQQKSKYGNDCGIEGIVWHCPDGSMYKIKTKDFQNNDPR